ncbi:DUF3043 domain-containing protein [Kutzneria sp. 744]|uniref:DUF3043 domain-containing protein n=1 Tax=Kutzneria sp. (strain 744) TaxID=345341 RepID=UPI0003EED49F|nr:DUF3043 domain-containing protein [Kutzneria sp. 744]EWM12760.1 integral membrane protein [Kutzneria sp. 744]
MRFLRRNSADDATPADNEAVDVDAGAHANVGKGRPTPKRREAEGRRRGPVPPPPRTQREAMRRNRELRPKMTREERSSEQRERREKMMSGDERYLMPKDRGPVKAYVRDIIDSRRNLMGLFMPMAILVLASYFVSQALPTLPVQEYVMLACLVFLLAMVVEAIMLGRLATRLARTKFPKESVGTAGLIWYTFTRASQVRRLRVPRPRVRPGQAVEA